MLRYRLIFGPILIVVVVLGLWLDEHLATVATPPAWRNFLGIDVWPPGLIVFLALIPISILASRELATILIDNGVSASKRINTFAAVAGLLLSCLIPSRLPGHVGGAVVITGSVVVLLFSLLYYSRRRTVEGVVAAAGGTLLSFVYLGLLLGFILAIRREHSAWIVLWIILVTKSSDIGAFFTGITLGRHKLIPWLSPGKTWEGFFGGVAFAAAVGILGTVVLKRFGVQGAPDLVLGGIAGALFAVIGQAGDLIESLFKRDAGIKDSGRSVPGFGGVLDVIDSLLLVGPVAYWILHFS